MANSVWVQEDQLTLSHAALEGRSPDDTVIVMVESLDWAQRLPHHKQKIVLVWSAMRHFADELRELGYTVDYHETAGDDPALQAHIKKFRPTLIHLMQSAEYFLATGRASLIRKRSIDAKVVANNMFLSDRDEFFRWSKNRKTLRMEDFYRDMRRRTGLLMHDGEPAGGKWNHDRDNRDTPDPEQAFPEIPRFAPDSVTEQLVSFVNREFLDHFGDCDSFAWPVTRSDAKRFALDFLDNRLDLFGPYQDAIVSGQPALYHSLLSPLLNVGLIDPMWLCREAERRYCDGRARLNSVEGFIRQIIGWREFVYQIYHLEMPQYLQANHFEAELPLPSFYWDGDTDMRCVADAVRSLIRNGINHHIQRLMVTGNFALIAGIQPQAVNEWYWLAYADAWEWVVTPNVLGMSLYADGGLLASKPYAASANYINRMSDCCGSCDYNQRQTVGAKACPFNSLYWDFIDRNRASLQANPRMKLALQNLEKREKRDPKKVQAIREQAAEIRNRLESGRRI